MVLPNNQYDAEAVYFFAEGIPSKEMLYVEFEAVLDGVVGIPDGRNATFNAVYVSIGRDKRVQTAVFFKVSFNDEGLVVDNWNLPLRYLASQAKPYHGLAESVNLVAACHCDGCHYRSYLWGTELELARTLPAIKKALQENKLALYSQFSSSSLMSHIAPGLLPGDLLRKDFHAPKEQDADDRNDQQVEKIVEKYKAMLRTKLEKKERIWQDKLAEKELLLHYAEEKQNQLQEEIIQLRRNIEAEKDRAIDDFIDEIANSGIEFIASEQGVGSFAIKPRFVFNYLDNPIKFLAKQCGTSQENYAAWRVHYGNPVCQAGASTGCKCAIPVKRVENPNSFVPGESDMCQNHRMKKVGEYY